ncbi:hypothetical protein SADUNF_Sadunf09G0117100 [Salix dunnii]|uniref:Uncharacterized protein n=1 Tax=Salix dunnii TaxID=1413687 RepID=A0A835JRU6_9ROSI|nr:hypothetical protein SADUNF_Sadunf09G0117100 [Salix dunnii]
MDLQYISTPRTFHLMPCSVFFQDSSGCQYFNPVVNPCAAVELLGTDNFYADRWHLAYSSNRVFINLYSSFTTSPKTSVFVVFGTETS